MAGKAEESHNMRLEELLGVGSFAETYRATITDDHLSRKWNKTVAVKVPRTPEDQDTIINDIVLGSRIQGVLSVTPEAQACERLVEFYGCVDFNGRYAMVSEFVDGKDLRKWLKKPRSARALSYVEIVDCITQACQGLAILHRAGIYHRDIKPSNILLVRLGEEIHVKLVDFGLSTALDYARHTVSGSKGGALAYRPPEIITVPTLPPRPTYDLYSLGVAFYEISCNRLPFKQLDEKGIIDEATNDNTPYTHPHAWALEVPDCLAEIIVKAIRKKPEDRYQSAQEMTDDLRAAREELEDAPSFETTVLRHVKEKVDAIMATLKEDTPSELSESRAATVEKDLRALTEGYPHQPAVFVALGEFYKDWLQDLTKESNAYEAGLEHSPGNPLLLYLLGVCLLGQPNPKDKVRRRAAECLKCAVQNGLQDRTAIRNAQRLFKRFGRSDESPSRK